MNKQFVTKLVLTGFVFFFLSGCASSDTISKQQEIQSDDIEIQNYEYIPKTTFVQYFSESYGEHNDLAKEIFDSINDQKSGMFTAKFDSREEAEQFVLDFNSKTFMPVDFAYENGIVLNTYENDGTATFSILEHTFNNIQTFNQFIGLSKELATTNSNEISYIQNLNQWICNNVQYDNAGVSNNFSTDIFSGTSRTEGISNAVQILCNLYGIGCELETGTVNGMPATWNKLYINSEPYYLDCTLNIYYQNPDAYTLSNELWDDHSQ